MSQTELRIKRKPPPFLDLSPAERYPAPDPNDPFAPLWVLRSRTSSAHLMQRQSIYNLSLDRRRQSAFSLQYASPNKSDDDMRAVMSDGEHSYTTRHSLRQSQTRQRSHSLAMLTNGGPQAYEFPSIHLRHGQRPWTGLGERSYSSTDVERRHRSQALHIASDATPAQKKLSYFLKSKKLPRVHKASISGPVLTSKPPVMNAFSLTLQTSVADPPHAIVSSPLAQVAPRRRPSTAPSVRVAPPRSQTVQLPITELISRKDSAVMSPPTSSVSHSAFIQISYPTPSDIYPQPIYENAYTSPRPAPRPPRDSATPLALNNPRKTSSRPTSKTNKSKPLPVVPPAVQSEWGLPSHEQLSRAASLLVIAESGVRVTFGSLFEKQRTIVIFIRHFWCPLCQDYMSSVRSFVRPDVLRSPATLGAGGSPAKLVVISNGSHAMISKYRQIFRMPFDMYTDPTLAVYTALGMGRGKDVDYPVEVSTLSEVSPKKSPGMDRQKKEDMIRNGGYVKHCTMGGIVMVVMRAIKVGMPVWEKGGDIAQLGGEFVFGPGLTCSFAHRMQSPKGHAPIQDVVKAALEVASRTSAAEKRKPLPAVDVHDRPASPVESTGIEDSMCSYEIVSNEIHAELQEDRNIRISEAEGSAREERTAQEPQYSEKSCWEDSVLTLDRDNGHEAYSDVASVTGTCSDQERSDGSTVQHSTESENTLNEPIEEASGQVYAKSPERLQSAQLELEN
ncbi:hypothetical protein APHAL10511_007413 [Amanita phalloides]|nr:hypothetical protein APHAL10511_007413 [Amanita phalloides]